MHAGVRTREQRRRLLGTDHPFASSDQQVEDIALDVDYRLLVPEQESVQPRREVRMTSTAILVAFLASSVFAFIFLAFPLGSTFTSHFNLAAILLSVLFFVARAVSFACYASQWWNIRKQTRRVPQTAGEAREIAEQKRHLPWIAGLTIFGLLVGIFILLTLTWHLPWTDIISGGAKGFHIGFINGLFFALFTAGSFLSTAFRLRPDDNKPKLEVTAARVVFVFSVLATCVAMVITATGPHFLSRLKELSGYSVLGINVFLGLLFSGVSLTAYAVKVMDYFGTSGGEEDRARRQRKKYEYQGTFLGFILGGLSAVGILIFKINPFGGDGLVLAGTAIMTLAAFPSLLSELGRALDENIRVPLERKSIYTQISNNSAWYYTALRWTVSMGLFVMLGFALHALSPLAGKEGLSLGLFSSPFFAMSLAALAILCIFYWRGVSHTPSIQNVSFYQALASVAPALKILRKLGLDAYKEHEEEQKLFLYAALEIHMARAEKILREGKSALLRYAGQSWQHQECVKAIQEDVSLLSRMVARRKEAVQQDQEIVWTKAELESAQAIFERLEKATIDPYYRVPLPTSKKYLLTTAFVGSTLLGIILVSLIWIGKIHAVAMPWIWFFPALCGFFSFFSARTLLEHARGGPYAALQAVSVFAAFVFLGLTAIALSGVPIMGVSIGAVPTTLFAVFAFISVELAFLLGRKAKQYVDRLGLPDAKSKGIAVFLNVLKISMAMGLLCMGYSSIGLFPAQKLGPFGAFFQQMLRIQVASLGITSIGIFAIAMRIAFELYKSVLHTFPSAVAEAKQNKEQVALGALLFKLAVVFPILLLKGIAPIFILPLFAMPFFSGKMHIPFFQKGNIFLKKFLGVEQFDTQGKTLSIAWRLKRECGVICMLGVLVLISTFISRASVSIFNMAGVISGIGMVATLFFRWIAIWHAHYNPVVLADSLLGASQGDMLLHAHYGPVPLGPPQLEMVPFAAASSAPFLGDPLPEDMFEPKEVVFPCSVV